MQPYRNTSLSGLRRSAPLNSYLRPSHISLAREPRMYAQRHRDRVGPIEASSLALQLFGRPLGRTSEVAAMRRARRIGTGIGLRHERQDSLPPPDSGSGTTCSSVSTIESISAENSITLGRSAHLIRVGEAARITGLPQSLLRKTFMSPDKRPANIPSPPPHKRIGRAIYIIAGKLPAWVENLGSSTEHRTRRGRPTLAEQMHRKGRHAE
jgi:hypothetical protein